jgi:hypothetical protein
VSRLDLLSGLGYYRCKSEKCPFSLCHTCFSDVKYPGQRGREMRTTKKVELPLPEECSKYCHSGRDETKRDSIFVLAPTIHVHYCCNAGKGKDSCSLDSDMLLIQGMGYYRITKGKSSRTLESVVRRACQLIPRIAAERLVIECEFHATLHSKLSVWSVNFDNNDSLSLSLLSLSLSLSLSLLFSVPLSPSSLYAFQQCGGVRDGSTFHVPGGFGPICLASFV